MAISWKQSSPPPWALNRGKATLWETFLKSKQPNGQKLRDELDVEKTKKYAKAASNCGKGAGRARPLFWVTNSRVRKGWGDSEFLRIGSGITANDKRDDKIPIRTRVRAVIMPTNGQKSDSGVDSGAYYIPPTMRARHTHAYWSWFRPNGYNDDSWTFYV